VKGTQWSKLNRRPAALLTFLNGLSLRRPDVDHCGAAGAALAALHSAGADFPLRRPNALGAASWPKLAHALLDQAEEVQTGLRKLIEDAVERIGRHWPQDLPQGVVHADLFPDNVLFMEGKVSGLIDFYFACNDALAYDVAVMLNAWCFESDGFNITKSRALVSAYRKERTLTDAEIDALPQLATGAALRFLLTRLHDLINHNPMALVRPKDPREFAKRLRFHLKVKSPSEYGI
jgi:homoserine kinase type II